MSSLLVLSLTISAIWTAWAWWTIISRAKPASAESLPGGTEANSIASAVPAAKTATTASSRSGLFCLLGEGRSLRGVGSIRIFYSPNRSDGTPRYSCAPNFRELRKAEVQLPRILLLRLSEKGKRVPRSWISEGAKRPNKAFQVSSWRLAVSAWASLTNFQTVSMSSSTPELPLIGFLGSSF
jgi:hypothetical protein